MSRSNRRASTSGWVGSAIAWAVVLPIALVAGEVAHAQERPEPERVTIDGRVLDEVNRIPIEGVLVHFVELGFSIMTNVAGQFEVTGLPLGVYQVQLSHDRYRTKEGDFAVAGTGSFVTLLTPLRSVVQAPPGRFLGRVTDGASGRPIMGVAVTVTRLFMQGVTNESGRFEIPAVPAGRYAVEFFSLGYAPRVDTLEMVSGQTTDARVRLSLDPLLMEPIEVTVGRREVALEAAGFYDRRADGFGEFIDRELIESRNPGEITDVFTGIPGVRLVPDPYNSLARTVVLRGGRMGWATLTGASDCYPFVVLDGQVIHRGGPTPANIDNFIDPETVAGIEIYPSAIGVPIQFAGVDASCGVIMIWTRR